MLIGLGSSRLDDPDRDGRRRPVADGLGPTRTYVDLPRTQTCAPTAPHPGIALFIGRAKQLLLSLTCGPRHVPMAVNDGVMSFKIGHWMDGHPIARPRFFQPPMWVAKG